MLLLIILSFSLQYYFDFRTRWSPSILIRSYLVMLGKRGPAIFSKPSWLGLLFLLAPLMMLAAVVFIVAHLLFFGLFYYLLTFFCFWSLTSVQAKGESDGVLLAVEELMEKNIWFLYSPLFWMVVTGSPVVLIGYVFLRELTVLYREQKQPIPCGEQVVTLFFWLNWVPVKLMGLTFGLVGNFSHVFASWKSNLFVKSNRHASDLAGLLKAALGFEHNISNSSSFKELVPEAVDSSQLGMELLCQHALMAWVVCICVLQVVSWLA